MITLKDVLTRQPYTDGSVETTVAAVVLALGGEATITLDQLTAFNTREYRATFTQNDDGSVTIKVKIRPECPTCHRRGA